MKIIGCRDKGFIVDVGRDELAQLMGFFGEYYLRDKFNLEVGSVLPVGDIFSKASEALGLEGEARKAATQLKNTAIKFLSFYEKPE